MELLLNGTLNPLIVGIVALVLIGVGASIADSIKAYKDRQRGNRPYRMHKYR